MKYHIRYISSAIVNTHGRNKQTPSGLLRVDLTTLYDFFFNFIEGLIVKSQRVEIYK